MPLANNLKAELKRKVPNFFPEVCHETWRASQKLMTKKSLLGILYSLAFQTIYTTMHPATTQWLQQNPSPAQIMYQSILNNNQGKGFNTMQINVLWQDSLQPFAKLNLEVSWSYRVKIAQHEGNISMKIFELSQEENEW